MLHAAGDVANNFKTPLNSSVQALNCSQDSSSSCGALFISTGTYNQFFRLSLAQTGVIAFLTKLSKLCVLLDNSTLSRKEEEGSQQQVFKEDSRFNVSVLLNFHVLHVFCRLGLQDARSA